LQGLGLAPGVYSSLRVRVDDGQGHSTVSSAAQLAILWAGDANEDGKVGFWDYLVLEYNYGKTGRTWTDADFNGDGKVSFADYLLLEQNFGKSITPPAPAPAPLAPVAAALAAPTAKAAKVAAAQTDAVRSIQAQTMTLIGWNSRAIRTAKRSKILQQVDSALARNLLALDRLI
jgi:hypothetical protein